MANTLGLRRIRHQCIISARRCNGDVANVEDGRDDAKEVKLFACGETNNIKSILECPPFLSIINTVDFASAFIKIFVVLDTTVEKEFFC